MLAAPSTAVAAAPVPSTPQQAYVDVSVATLWAQPHIARAVDRPALTRPVHMSRWLAGLTVARRRWLVGRLETQVLYGTRVEIVGRSGRWSRIVVPSQNTPRDARGYPGWLPTVQLTGNTSLTHLARSRVAVVVRSRPHAGTLTGGRSLRLSYGTRLAVVGSDARRVVFATPDGGRLTMAKSAVSVYRNRASIPRPTGADVVAAARGFLGLPYLWAGTSGWGFDCSGLTYTVYRRFGIDLPRDAQVQAVRGTPVPRRALRPGDLLFFAGAGGTGAVHHVAIDAGGGMMIESPRTGSAVRIVAVSGRLGEFAGARRYL